MSLAIIFFANTQSICLAARIVERYGQGDCYMYLTKDYLQFPNYTSMVIIMTLKELQYFIAVYEESSIAKASERLFVTPSVISIALKRLEDEFDIKLFSRSANRIAPTAAGAFFYKRALQLMNDLALLKQDIRIFNNKGDDHKDVCHIGMSAILLSVFGEEINIKLDSTFPNIRFDICSYQSLIDCELLDSYDIIIALFYSQDILSKLSCTSSDLSFEKVATVQPYIWLSNSSPLLAHKLLSYDMLTNYKYLVYNNSVNYSEDALSEFLIPKENFHNTKLKRQFINGLENLSYFTTDLPLKHGQLVFQELFAGHNLAARPVKGTSSIELIYKNNFSKDFIPQIKLTLLEFLSPK